MIVLGLMGAAGAGKDSVASIVLRDLGGERYAFADPLRAEVAAAFGVDPWSFSDRAAKERPHDALRPSTCADTAFAALCHQLRPYRTDDPLSPRQALQWWGTEYRRAQHPDYWLVRASERAAVAATRSRLLAVTDVRYPNEAAWIRSRGGVLWRVDREVADVAAHDSERAWRSIDVDAVIRNDGTLDELERLVRDLCWDLVESER